MGGRLEGKVAVITGTAGGQGRAAAVRFAREGARVVGCDLKEEEAQETVGMVRDGGGEMVSQEPTDLTDEAQVESLMRLAVDTYGGIDVLYNNAGAVRTGAVDSLSVEDFDYTLQNEVTLIFSAVKHALPVFKDRGGGSIINTGSIAGNVGTGIAGNIPGLVAHGAAKAAVIRLSQHMAIELSPHNVRVNAVSPGVIDTPALRPILGDEEETPTRRAFTDQLLVRRIGRSEDVVNAAVFLASDEASYVTGINLVVDGGWTASGGLGQPSQRVGQLVEESVSAFFSSGYQTVPTPG